MTRLQHLGLAFCLTLSVAVNLQSVAEEFLFGHKGWCAARRAVAARNFVRHGFSEAKYGPVENLNPKAEPAEFEHYWHHPVGIHLLVGASFSVLGVGEWQARLVPVILMILGFLLFADMARRWWPNGPGRWAAMVLFITTPMLAYYGPFVNQEALVLLFCLLSLWTWMRWQETKQHRWIAASAVVAILGAWSDWPWFVFAFWLACTVAMPLVKRRQIEWTWLVPFCAAVLVGFFGVLWHLSELYGGDDFIQAFRDVGRFRQHGKGKTIAHVLNRQGPRWVDLMTPTLILAGFVWPWLARRDAKEGRWSMKHNAALAFLGLGVAWVVIFRQGAWVHDFWPMFAAVYFVIAGADVIVALAALAQRAAQWRPGPQWAKHITAAVATGLIVLQGAAGIAGTHYRTRFADPAPKEGEDYRRRHAVVARWINEQTTPDDQIAVHDQMLTAKFQFAFYLDRRFRRLKVTESTTTLKGAARSAMAVVDLRSMPQLAIPGLQTNALSQHPVTVIEDFLVVDLRETVSTPELSWLRLVSQPADLWHRWLVSHVYPPQTLVVDHWLEAEMLLATGHENEAERRREQAPPPETVRQHAAAHNLALQLGDTPPAVDTWLTEVGTALDPPLKYGGKLLLHGYKIRPVHRDGEVIEAVFEVLHDPGSGWRPFLNRMSRPLNEDGPEAKMPMTARVLSAESTWKKGKLLVVRVYSGLNAWRDRVRYELGFWRPAPKSKKPTKAKRKDAPSQHLRVGKEKAGVIKRFDWKGRSPVPLPLRWIPYLSP